MAVFVRRDVYSLAPTDPTLTWYGRAVAAMQQQDASLPISWAYQSAMHGTYSTPPLDLWNGCEHGTWYFTAWHRMYVYYFERIVRAFVVRLGGPADWALPYWNYTPSDRGNPVLPPAFRDPASPLYVWERRVRPYNVNAGGPLPDVVTDISLPMTRPTFLVPPTKPVVAGFGGQVTAPVHFDTGFGALEQQPHNVVHDALGGTYGWMADPNFAAQDPIFWLHHSNIDRLWASWNVLGHTDTDLPWWLLQTFSFYDETGVKRTHACGDVMDTTALGYTYDRMATIPGQGDAGPSDAAPRAAAERTELVGASHAPVLLTGGRTTSTVPVDARARDAVLADAAGGTPREVYLVLDDIEAARNPGTVYAVYVNLPAGVTGTEAEEHVAGALSFFGIEKSGVRADGSRHEHAYRAGFDITDLVRRLSARGQWDPDHVVVTFHPAGQPLEDEAAGEPNLPTVTVGRISVHYG